MKLIPLLKKSFWTPLVLILGMTFASEGQAADKFTQAEINASPYLKSVLGRMNQRYDTTKFRKPGPYRIALAAQGTSNSWSALFDEHAFWYTEELGGGVVEELLYADAQASADNQVPQVEDLLAQEPDALPLDNQSRYVAARFRARKSEDGAAVVAATRQVTDAIEKYLEEEVLTGDEQWHFLVHFLIVLCRARPRWDIVGLVHNPRQPHSLSSRHVQRSAHAIAPIL